MVNMKNIPPSSPYYGCSNCRICIAFSKHIVMFGKELSADLGNTVIFEKTGNLVIDQEEPHLRINNCTIANVYCLSCHSLLGSKIIQVDPPAALLKAGRFALHLNKLLLCGGELKDLGLPPLNLR